MKLMTALLMMFALNAAAQEILEEEAVPTVPPELMDADREPASVGPMSGKRAYPGGTDEEDLRVQSALPEAPMRTDARSVQREVFKALYNQELKDERHDPVEE